MATFNVKTRGSTINVEVEIPQADPKRLNRNPVSIVVDDVLDYLTANGIEVDSCLKQQTLSNRGKSPKLSGIFSFQKKKAKKTPMPKKEEVSEDTPVTTDNDSIDDSAVAKDSSDTIESTENTEEAEKPKRQYTKRKKVYSEYSQ